MGDFQKLYVWKLSKNLAVEVYKAISESEMLKKDFRLSSQLSSSAVSISSNIAEGDELKTVKHGLNHMYIAKGSTAELITQLIIAKEIEAIESSRADLLINSANQISAALYKLIEARKNWRQN